VHLGLITVVVSEYDPAISFFVDALGFELAEDFPAVTNDGRARSAISTTPIPGFSPTSAKATTSRQQ
jgi:catechol 2,3-dioxygenase-like lactoylglutathione lyase family enzyme